jgi:RHS repeat-associated protein
VPLQATDPDGDPVTFSVRSPGPLPTGALRGDGTLVFTPTPAEAGTYTLTLVGSDGAAETTQDVTLTVAADLVTTTRLSGIVRDAAGNPLAGVPLDVGAAEVTTAADGSFLFDFGGGPVPAGPLTVHGERVPGPGAYPLLTAQLSLLLGHQVFAGVNNVLAGPVVLTPLDTADAVTVNPAQDTTVTTPALPGASLRVPAGTLRDARGNPYAGPLGITEVSPGAAPVPLPDGLLPDLMVLVQPGGLTFTAPAALALPNRAGWAAGTAMDLWALDPAGGSFTRTGAGRVSADGSLVQTTSGGASAATLFFFVPQLPADPALDQDPFNLDAGANEHRQVARFGSDVDLHSGVVSTDDTLVAYQSLGISRSLTLHYDSLRADPRPIVHFGTGSLPADPNLLLAARLTVRRGNFTYDVPGFTGASQFGLQANENFWKLPDGGGPVEAALQADLRSQPSGEYVTELATGLLRLAPARGSVPAHFAGALQPRLDTLVSVNGIGSAFGSGWDLVGHQQLVEDPDGSVLLIDGGGSQLLFSPPPHPGDPYVSPAGDFSTLVRLPDGTFQRTLKDQTVCAFDDAGRLATVTDRNGNQTRYQYDLGDRLVAIVDPVGLETTFTYAAGQVAITDPAQRVTTLHLDDQGNLVAVTDPDGSERHWEYDGQHHLTAEIDKRGNRDQDFYDFAGRAVASHRADGSTVQIAPAQTHGLFPAGRTADPSTAPPAVGPATATSSVADPDGHVVTTTLDRFGQFQSATDEIGPVQSVTRNAQNLVAESIDARSHLTSYTYDGRGNVLTVQDALSGAFGVPLSYTVGAGPAAVAVADLDGDGTPDLVTANHDDNSLSVLPGMGDGTFGTRTDLPANNHPADVAVADVNRDGHPDLIAANTRFPSGVSVLLGHGDGTFAAAFRTGVAITDRIALGDLNGDGIPDLVETETSDGGVTVSLGDGSDKFGSDSGGVGRQYDGLERLTGLVHSHAGSPVASYQYAFDAGSRLTRETRNDGTSDYSYDNIDQLTGANHHGAANPAESYTYDPSGNRTTSGTQARSYQIGTDNRLASDGTFTYTDDNEGNLVRRTETATGRVREFQWDERNRLVAVTDRDAAGNVAQQVLFTYDALDHRIAEELKHGGTDVVTYFVDNGDNHLLDFVDDDGPAGPQPPALAMRYLTGPALDQVFAQEDAAGTVTWPIADHLGTVRDLVDNSGAVVNHITYESFGNVVAQTHPAVTSRFLFAGREFDMETGLYYARARYYDPKLGRFLSEDPLRFLAGTNLYRYVHNNPVSRIDPRGTQDENPDGDPLPTEDQSAGGSMSTPEVPAEGPMSTPEAPFYGWSQPADQPEQRQQAQPQSDPTIIWETLGLLASGFGLLWIGIQMAIRSSAAEIAKGLRSPIGLPPGVPAEPPPSFTPLRAPPTPEPVTEPAPLEPTPPSEPPTEITDVARMLADTLGKFLIVPAGGLIQQELNQMSGHYSDIYEEARSHQY